LGIVFRKITPFEVFGLFLIISGVLCKTIYIIAKARSGEYKPGRELIFLFSGLLIFLSGLYLRSQPEPLLNPLYLIITGLVLKTIFIFRFIYLVRTVKKD
jgi:hypothetical protein